MISFNSIFDLVKIGKQWYQRNTISQSCNIGLYITPRLKITNADLEDDFRYNFTNIEHESHEHESNNNETFFDKININDI